MTKLKKDVVLAKARGQQFPNLTQLNICGLHLTDVSIIEELRRLEILVLSVNDISTLRYFQNLDNLRELYLRKNSIQDLREIRHLKNLKKLNVLSLLDNPCANESNYFSKVLSALPNLNKIDEIIVSDDDRERAKQLGNSWLQGAHIPNVQRTSCNNINSHGDQSQKINCPSGKLINKEPQRSSHFHQNKLSNSTTQEVRCVSSVVQANPDRSKVNCRENVPLNIDTNLNINHNGQKVSITDSTDIISMDSSYIQKGCDDPTIQTNFHSREIVTSRNLSLDKVGKYNLNISEEPKNHGMIREMRNSDQHSRYTSLRSQANVTGYKKVVNAKVPVDSKDRSESNMNYNASKDKLSYNRNYKFEEDQKHNNRNIRLNNYQGNQIEEHKKDKTSVDGSYVDVENYEPINNFNCRNDIPEKGKYEKLNNFNIQDVPQGSGRNIKNTKSVEPVEKRFNGSQNQSFNFNNDGYFYEDVAHAEPHCKFCSKACLERQLQSERIHKVHCKNSMGGLSSSSGEDPKMPNVFQKAPTAANDKTKGKLDCYNRTKCCPCHRRSTSTQTSNTPIQNDNSEIATKSYQSNNTDENLSDAKLYNLVIELAKDMDYNHLALLQKHIHRKLSENSS